jgi:hypothetical protein
LAMSGIGLSQQLRQSIAYDAEGFSDDHIDQQRRMLATMLAAYIERAVPNT